MAKEEAIQVQGKVVQALANTQFRVRLDNGHELIALLVSATWNRDQDLRPAGD